MESLSSVHIFGLTSINLAYGFMIANQGLLILPLESERLFPKQASIALAAIAMSGGVAQLIGPAAGRWSDHYRATEGHRLPALVRAAVVTVVLTGLLPVASSLLLGYSYWIIFFSQQIAWNVLVTTYQALVPDLVPAEQRGVAGGVAASLMLVGAFAGLLSVRFVSQDHESAKGAVDYVHYYIALVTTTTCAVVVVLTAMSQKVEQSRQFHLADLASVRNEDSFMRQVYESYKFDGERYPEFAKLLVAKACYNANIAVKGFLMFFIQDTFHFNSSSAEQALVGDISMAAEACAAVGAVAALAFLSRKTSPAQADTNVLEVADPGVVLQAQRAGMGGALWMALLWLGPPFVAFGVLRDSETSVKTPLELAEAWGKYMVLGCALWGLGQGVYLAGDQALGYVLLPDRNEASRYLGITSVYSSLGLVVGGGGAGAMLYIFGSIWAQEASPDADGPGYGYPGYLALFLFAACVNACVGIVLASINPREELTESTRIMKTMT